MDYYIFLIDTDHYAGNFERQMTAWCTGIVGDCGVGKAYAGAFLACYGREIEEVMTRPDDNGCWRPTAIFPTPGWSNDGMGHSTADTSGPSPAYQSVGIFFAERPDSAIITLIQQRAASYQPLSAVDAPAPRILSFRLLYHRTIEEVIAVYPVDQQP